MTREEHLQWCKDKALEYVEKGQLTNAYSSMTSDLRKHPETRDHLAISLGEMLLINGQLSTKEKMSDFIKGFN